MPSLMRSKLPVGYERTYHIFVIETIQLIAFATCLGFLNTIIFAHKTESIGAALLVIVMIMLLAATMNTDPRHQNAFLMLGLIALGIISVIGSEQDLIETQQVVNHTVFVSGLAAISTGLPLLWILIVQITVLVVSLARAVKLKLLLVKLILFIAIVSFSLCITWAIFNLGVYILAVRVQPIALLTDVPALYTLEYPVFRTTFLKSIVFDTDTIIRMLTHSTYCHSVREKMLKHWSQARGTPIAKMISLDQRSDDEEQKEYSVTGPSLHKDNIEQELEDQRIKAHALYRKEQGQELTTEMKNVLVRLQTRDKPATFETRDTASKERLHEHLRAAGTKKQSLRRFVSSGFASQSPMEETSRSRRLMMSRSGHMFHRETSRPRLLEHALTTYQRMGDIIQMGDLKQKKEVSVFHPLVSSDVAKSNVREIFSAYSVVINHPIWTLKQRSLQWQQSLVGLRDSMAECWFCAWVMPTRARLIVMNSWLIIAGVFFLQVYYLMIVVYQVEYTDDLGYHMPVVARMFLYKLIRCAVHLLAAIFIVFGIRTIAKNASLVEIESYEASDADMERFEITDFQKIISNLRRGTLAPWRFVSEMTSSDPTAAITIVRLAFALATLTEFLSFVDCLFEQLFFPGRLLNGTSIIISGLVFPLICPINHHTAFYFAFAEAVIVAIICISTQQSFEVFFTLIMSVVSSRLLRTFICRSFQRNFRLLFINYVLPYMLLMESLKPFEGHLERVIELQDQERQKETSDAVHRELQKRQTLEGFYYPQTMSIAMGSPRTIT